MVQLVGKFGRQSIMLGREVKLWHESARSRKLTLNF